MNMLLSVDPPGLEAFAAANTSAAEVISSAGSADSAANLSAAAAAVGPIGTWFLGAYGPAQANNLAATQCVAGVHAAIGAATQVSQSSFIATDNQ